jgi:ornithine cyclodeaminase/alanine dehydrogenase
MGKDGQPEDERPRFLSFDACRAALDWPEVVARLADAYASPLAPAASPPRVVARDGASWVRGLVAVPPSGKYMGCKIFGVGPGFRVNYVILLIEKATGLLRGIVDGGVVTARRTAGTSAVAVDRIAPRRPLSVALLGSGEEARSHIEAMAAVRSLTEVRIYSPTATNREKLAAYCREALGLRAVASASAEDAVRGSELVVAAARSSNETPILMGAWLDAAVMVVSIGSTMAEQREIDASVVEICDLIVCDVPDEVADQTGDMIAATEAGIDFRGKLVGLDQLGGAEARIRGARLPMFKSVGAGIQDIVIAELAFERALADGTAPAIAADFYVKC